MLRLIFASSFLIVGAIQSVRGPFYALLLYLGIAYFRPELWIWSGELRALNISFIVGVYAVAYTLLSSERFTITMPMWLIAAFCLHALISTELSAVPVWCFPWWKGFAKVSTIAILIIGLVNTQERLRLVMLVLAFTLGFEGVKQGWVHLITAPDVQNINSVEILGDNNGVAVGMLMLAAILLALLQTTKKKWLKPVFAFMLLGVVFRSLTSYSRGGFLAFGAMCATYLLRSRRPFTSAVLVGSLLLLLPLLPDRYWDRMETISADNQGDASAQGRLHFWSVAQRMANEHPLLGVGTSGFQAVYNAYDPSGGAFGRSRAVHSMWFGVLAEQGYVGLIMLCSILILAFRACGRARKASIGVPDRQEILALSGAMQTALVTVCVGGTFLSYHYVEILWHFIGLSFAIENVALRAATPEETSPAQVGFIQQPALRAS